MNAFSKILITLSALCFSLPLRANHSCDFPLQRTVELSQEIKYNANTSHRELVVDNFFGFIRVQGYEGDSVQLESTRHISARNEERAEAALTEVKIEIQEQGDAIILYIDSPYRKSSREYEYRGCRHYGYKNTFDLTLRVPFETDLYLSTIDGGDIEVERNSGSVSLHNVNGNIVANALSSTADISTVNGDLDLHFTALPTASSNFRSVNGNITLSSSQKVNADLQFETLNGSVYTNFPVDYSIATDIGNHGRSDTSGLTNYFSQDKNRVRAGTGGALLSFSTVNGNITIKNLDTNAKKENQ